MELTTIRELYKNSDSYMDQKVTIGGWVRSIRGSKAFGFIVVNDGTFFEQIGRARHIRGRVPGHVPRRARHPPAPVSVSPA